MISILIPVYNFDVRRLVSELAEQCRAAGISFEIICLDDGSETHFRQVNRELGKRDNVIYEEMPFNLGRSAIRNALAEKARFPYLLFMDCDSGVVRQDFMEKYVRHARPDSLVYGGRCYSDDPPAGTDKVFHWYYGSEREVRPAETRQESPYQNFMTNNFLIPRDIFLRIRLDERLKQYGHEDTLFGLELEDQGVPIIHIDNPLRHEGLETTEEFLQKTRQGLENLMWLWQNGTRVDTRLLRVFLKIRSWGLAQAAGRLFPLIRKPLERSFHGGNTDLRLFDLYKLACLCWYFGKIE